MALLLYINKLQIIYDPGTEEYVLKNAYDSYLKYDFENAAVPEDLDEMFHEIDKASSVETQP